MTDRELQSLFHSYWFTAATSSPTETKQGIVEKLLRQAWCRETCSPNYARRWSIGLPEAGQCAVSALVVQDLLYGEVMRCEIPEYGSHYYNSVWNYGRVHSFDCTKLQFPPDVEIPVGEPVERERILDSERAIAAGTRTRYELLRERVARAMTDEMSSRHAEAAPFRP